ncbi:MAG: cytochrome d ubiquinol oxidase subunit II [Planctomycetota bacterium]|nr:cytochrome d ubiquinol oxidase subunit II [Planctomycetota bacterium]
MPEFTFLQIIWFILIGVLLAGYAVLDGFDLGVGILHPLAKSDRDRRIFINAIGPIWDGNEVWLVTFGGALFAAFPYAYATIFSGFYIAFMLLLLCLILRAVSIEFRGKIESAGWRRVWDFGFFISSLLATLLFGVAVGNGILGIPLDERYVFTGTFWTLLNPYAICVGLLAVSMFAMHGALYLYLKTPEGELHDRLRGWMWHTWGLFLVMYILTTIFTLITVERAVPNFQDFPWAGLIVVVNVLAIANIPRAIYAGRPGQAFISSCLTIVALICLFSLALWPNLVTASNAVENSLTIGRAASSEKTLSALMRGDPEPPKPPDPQTQLVFV